MERAGVGEHTLSHSQVYSSLGYWWGLIQSSLYSLPLQIGPHYTRGAVLDSPSAGTSADTRGSHTNKGRTGLGERAPKRRYFGVSQCVLLLHMISPKEVNGWLQGHHGSAVFLRVVGEGTLLPSATVSMLPAENATDSPGDQDSFLGQAGEAGMKLFDTWLKAGLIYHILVFQVSIQTEGSCFCLPQLSLTDQMTMDQYGRANTDTGCVSGMHDLKQSRDLTASSLGFHQAFSSA